MAIVKGVNAGFLLEGVSPSADPVGGAGGLNCDDTSNAGKFIAPVGATKVTEIGWWCENNTQEANFDVGIYTHNAGDDNPEAKVGDFSIDNAKGTTAGWKKVTGLNIAITAETTYWIAVQIDDTLTATPIDRQNSSGERRDRSTNNNTALVDPWGISNSNGEQLLAIYAVTDAAPDSRVRVEMLGSC